MKNTKKDAKATCLKFIAKPRSIPMEKEVYFNKENFRINKKESEVKNIIKTSVVEINGASKSCQFNVNPNIQKLKIPE